MATGSSTGSSTLNGHGLIVVPCCANPAWVADHGSPTVDIVAIHGLNGKRWSTWTYKAKGKTDVMWLQDLLPHKLPQARVMTFGYNADMINNYATSNIRDHARKLLSLLRNKRDEGDQASRPIIFVCHSLGGIVAKQALRIATNETPYNSIANSTRGIVFMGTPHRGSDLAFWGNILAGISKAAFLHPTPNIKVLKNNSATLMDVSEDFRSIVGNYSIVSFYEDAKIKGVGKEVVGKHSAVMEITGEEAVPLAGNHMEICTFSGVGDERFEEVWKAIKRVIESKPAQNTDAKRALVQRLTQLAQFDHLRFLEEMPSPLEGTCSWILDHPAYRSWLECSGISILHMLGKPGCGKSMISKYLLADSKSRLDWISTGYFSFSATEGRQNLIQVYASFLLQILAFATSMYPRIIEACSANPKGEWNEKDLETLLEEALAIFPRRRVILVLDALDECHAFGSEVLCAITKVCRKAPWCKVLVTSRPKEGMPREEDVTELNLDKEPGLEADIKLFIADRVNLLMKARPFFAPLKSEIAKRLNERADGMFLLVEHIHRSLLNLKGTSRNSIRQVLRSLPRTLADAYSQTFDRVQPEDIEFGSNVLICLLYAARPMTVSELAIAIAITEQTPNFTEMADDVALSVLYDINTRIGPIVTVSNDYVSLIHASMKDFLLSTVNSDLADTANSEGASSRNLRPDPRKWYIIGRDEANNDLLSRCMKYLSLYFLESKGRLDRLPRALSPASQQVNNEENFEPNSKECEGFLSYVVENLPDHARKLSKTSRRERRRVREFFESSRFWQWASLFWEEKDPSRSPSDLGPLAMACLLGLKLTVEDLVAPGNRNSLRFDSDRSIRDIYKVLAAAIEGGSTEILSLLINSGASIDGFIKLGEKRTLLSVAVWYGRTEMIALLLDKSNYLSLSDEETNGSTPIDIAVEAGRQSTVRWLHDNGAPLNLGNHPWQRRYLSALHVAVRSHRSGMIPMLLKLGADAREPTRDGDFAFHMAAQLGDLAALEILKPHDVDARDANENTALLRAVEALQKEMVLYLLKEGADVNARNNRGSLGTAAYLALSKRTKDDHQKAREVVELLLCHGFDMQSEEVGVILYAVVESDNIFAFSFLQVWPGSFSSRVRLDSAGVWMLASNIRAIDICHSLLQTNAVDVNTCDADGTTALAAAVKRGDIAFCQKLISNCHAKTTVRDKEGRTPLHATTQLWPREVGLEIASLILDHDDSQLSNFMRDNRGLTALHLAVYCGNVEMAKFLLERGAAVDALDTTGRTSLYCCNFRNSVLVTLLLEAGADPTVRAHSGKSAAIRIADSGEEEAMEILFRRGFSFSESDVLEATKVGKQEVRISCLLWYIYLNGNIELVQNMSKNGMMSSNDKEMGLKWALEKRKRPVLDLLAPMLEKNQVKEFVGQELVTWLLFPDSEKRTQSILFILLSDYVDLNKAYSPPSERDCRAVHRRITVNPLMKAIERGEHIFVRAMLENQASLSISSRFLDSALRLARKERHEEVANILAGHIEALASQRE